MNKAGRNVVSVIAIVLVLGGVGAAAFYQDEVHGFIRLQGWNTKPITDASKQFVQAAASNDGKKVASLIAREAPQLDPISDSQGVTAFRIGDYGGPKKHTLKQMCPTGSPQFGSPKLIFLEGGAAQVEARFPNHRLQLTWDRKPEGWKLIGLGWAQ
jgi:hypothetical protein